MEVGLNTGGGDGGGAEHRDGDGGGAEHKDVVEHGGGAEHRGGAEHGWCIQALPS